MSQPKANTSEERLQQLCRRATVEEDPAQMLQLVRQINQLLEAKSRKAPA